MRSLKRVQPKRVEQKHVFPERIYNMHCDHLVPFTTSSRNWHLASGLELVNIKPQTNLDPRSPAAGRKASDRERYGYKINRKRLRVT